MLLYVIPLVQAIAIGNILRLDKFIDDIKKKHGGDIVFVAMSVEDYKHMAYNTQELKRYINQLGEVIVYYRNVTINDADAAAVEIQVKENEN